MQFVWGGDATTPSPIQTFGPQQQPQQSSGIQTPGPHHQHQQPQHTGARTTEPPSAVHGSMVEAAAPPECVSIGPQGKAKAAATEPQSIRLSDSMLTDDALLARFMREGLAHLQV